MTEVGVEPQESGITASGPKLTAAPISNGGLDKYVSLLTWTAVVLTLVFLALIVLGSGYYASGDAQRHVAMAYAGKTYPDVLVLQPWYKLSHNAGWETILQVVQRATSWNADSLMSFSIALSMLAVLLAPLPWLHRPEAWLAALLCTMIVEPNLLPRLTQSRPFLITGAVLIMLLAAWTKPLWREQLKLKLILSTMGISASVWIHGAWYLWVLPVLGFFAAGWFRAGFLLSLCAGIGVLGGSLLSGSPVTFLTQSILKDAHATSGSLPPELLVPEIQPGDGHVLPLLLVAIVALWRTMQGAPGQTYISNPLVCFIAICWIFSFKADRFWSDWALPAMLLWLAQQFQEIMAASHRIRSVHRLLLCGLLALPILLHSKNTLETFTRILSAGAVLDASKPEIKDWLPEPGGVFYSAEMGFFYNTFYANPRGDWKYILGMEPALMPPEDQQTFRNIQISGNAPAAYQPWIQKMHSGDRLAVNSIGTPEIPELDWIQATGSLWIGKRKAL